MSKSIGSILNGIPYSIIRSDRRTTPSLQVNSDEVRILTPTQTQDSEILALVEYNLKWIFKTHAELRAKKMSFKTRFTTLDMMQRTIDIAHKMKVELNGVIVKKLKTKWSGINADKVVTLNSLLSRAPGYVVDYIIIHALCNIKMRNSSDSHSSLLRQYMPHYEQSEDWLKTYGSHL